MKPLQLSWTVGLTTYSAIVTLMLVYQSLLSPASARFEQPTASATECQAPSASLAAPIRQADTGAPANGSAVSSGGAAALTSDDQTQCVNGMAPEVELSMRKQQVDLEIRNYRRVATLSADQVTKLREILMRQFGPSPDTDGSPEALEALTAQYDREIQAVVGKKAVDDLAQFNNDEQSRVALQTAEAEAAYISRAIDLPENRFEQLVNALGADNRQMEEAVSYRTKRLHLSTEQESALRKVWNEANQNYDLIEEFIGRLGGEGALDESYYTYASSDHSPDPDRVMRLYVRSQMRSLLSPEQYQQLLTLDDVTTPDPLL